MSIHPDKLNEPFTIDAIDEMVESWRGVSQREVPASVRAMAYMRQLHKQAIEEGVTAAMRLQLSMGEIEYLDAKVQAFHRIRKALTLELDRWAEVVKQEVAIQKYEKDSAVRRRNLGMNGKKKDDGALEALR